MDNSPIEATVDVSALPEEYAISRELHDALLSTLGDEAGTRAAILSAIVQVEANLVRVQQIIQQLVDRGDAKLPPLPEGVHRLE